MHSFKLKSLAAPKSVSGSTLTTPDKFALIARCARLKRELKINRKILGIWGLFMINRKTQYKQNTMKYSNYIKLLDYLSKMCNDKEYQKAMVKLDKFKIEQ